MNSLQDYSERHLLEELFQSLSFGQEEVSHSNQEMGVPVEAPPMPWETNPNQIHQYNAIYLDRLKRLSERIKVESRRKIQDLNQLNGTVSVVGIFKRIEAKRVRAFERGYNEYYENAVKIYSDEDGLELEDSTGRVRFILAQGAHMNGRPIFPTEIPNGIIVGLTGNYLDSKHYFVAQRITLPQLPPQRQFLPKHNQDSRKMLVLSEFSPLVVCDILKELVELQYEPLNRMIDTVVVMGLGEKILSAELKELDGALCKYSHFIRIFLMPGENSRESFPQKPIHPVLFNASYRSSSVQLVSNPQYFSPDSNSQASILLFSGQNVNDLDKNCSFGESSLDRLQSIIQFSHMAPTAPFSLKSWMMPQDYLVLDEMPHLVISGQGDRFSTREVDWDGKRVRLVTMKRGQMALVDTGDLSVSKYVSTVRTQ